MISSPLSAPIRISIRSATAKTTKVMKEQDQAERNQRGGIKLAHGFGELIGDGGRDGGSGRQQVEGTIRWALPMTKVTAMVSPSARPNPSMTAPMTPTLA